MAQPLTQPLPPNLELWGGCTVGVAALDPTTGAPVSGVNIANVTLEIEQTEGSEAELESGPFMLVTGPQG